MGTVILRCTYTRPLVLHTATRSKAPPRTFKPTKHAESVDEHSAQRSISLGNARQRLSQKPTRRWNHSFVEGLDLKRRIHREILAAIASATIAETFSQPLSSCRCRLQQRWLAAALLLCYFTASKGAECGDFTDLWCVWYICIMPACPRASPLFTIFSHGFSWFFNVFCDYCGFVFCLTCLLPRVGYSCCSW